MNAEYRDNPIERESKKSMKEWLSHLLLMCVALLAPIKPMIIATGILIFMDTFLGVWAAKKRNEPITSAAFRRSVSKILIYQTTLITGYICEIYLIGSLVPISKLVAGVIGIVEITSILENANTINGSPIFKSLISKLGSENDNQ